MRAIVPLLVLALAAVAAGCGGSGKSADQQAQDQVCSARADIQTQLDALKGLTVSPASVPTLTASLNAIKGDLQSIAKAEGQLSGQRKQAAKEAAQAFGSQLGTIAGNLVSGIASGSTAQSQLDAAAQQLATGFKQAFAPVAC
jgi:hypothetical protein